MRAVRTCRVSQICHLQTPGCTIAVVHRHRCVKPKQHHHELGQRKTALPGRNLSFAPPSPVQVARREFHLPSSEESRIETSTKR